MSYVYKGNMSNDTMYTEFYRKKTFTDLSVTEHGLSYSVFYVIEQKLWDLGKNRERLHPDTPRIKSRVLTSRVQVSQRKSTGEVIGHSVITGNSLTDSSASARSVRLALIKTKRWRRRPGPRPGLKKATRRK